MTDLQHTVSSVDSSTMKRDPDHCGWCLDGEPAAMLYTVPTCSRCAASTTKERVYRWMRAVHERNERLIR